MMDDVALDKIELINQFFAEEGMNRLWTALNQEALLFHISQSVEKWEKAIVISTDMDGIVTIGIDGRFLVGSLLGIENDS